MRSVFQLRHRSVVNLPMVNLLTVNLLTVNPTMADPLTEGKNNGFKAQCR